MLRFVGMDEGELLSLNVARIVGMVFLRSNQADYHGNWVRLLTHRTSQDNQVPASPSGDLVSDGARMSASGRKRSPRNWYSDPCC